MRIICFAAAAAVFSLNSALCLGDNSIARKYEKACGICHGVGVAGAPKRGDAESWGTRSEKSIPDLLDSINTGLGAMPPKGMCSDCSQQDFEALIDFMLPKYAVK